MSALSENVSQALKSLEKEYIEGDLTEKGYLKRKSKLLEPFRHLMFMNGSREGGSNRTTPTIAADQHRVNGGGRRGGGGGGEGGRKGGGGGGEGQEGHAVNGEQLLIQTYCILCMLKCTVYSPCTDFVGLKLVYQVTAASVQV